MYATGPHAMLEDFRKALLAKVEELVPLAVAKEVHASMPQLLDEALDRQRKTVGDEIVRILLDRRV